MLSFSMYVKNNGSPQQSKILNWNNMDKITYRYNMVFSNIRLKFEYAIIIKVWIYTWMF